MLNPTPSAPARVRARCVELASVFQSPLLEEPLGTGATTSARRQHAELIGRAQAACQECPLIAGCLYAAVVEHDVAGFVAGTTPAQRSLIRRRLQVSVEPEDFDTLAGVIGRHRQIDHDQLMRLRNSHPDESLERLARRLGCSLSTVKRHLRNERRTPSVRRPESVKPTLAAVMAAAADVVGTDVVGTARRRPQAA